MEELATRLGLSRGAAERRWARAIALLMDRLARMESSAGIAAVSSRKRERPPKP
jgi:hypothetical protein